MTNTSGSPGTPAPGQKARERQISYTRWLGLAFVTAGFVAVALGWSGMSGAKSADAQLPYLLSGGATGLGLIVFGVALLVMAQLRAAGRSSYHLRDCRLIKGKPDMEIIGVQEAALRGLSPCRVCQPDAAVAQLPSDGTLVAPDGEVAPTEGVAGPPAAEADSDVSVGEPEAAPGEAEEAPSEAEEAPGEPETAIEQPAGEEAGAEPGQPGPDTTEAAFEERDDLEPEPPGAAGDEADILPAASAADS